MAIGMIFVGAGLIGVGIIGYWWMPKFFLPKWFLNGRTAVRTAEKAYSDIRRENKQKKNKNP